MAMHYRLGWPFGKAVAKLGIPVVISIRVIRDEEAGVFVGTSSDVQGFVVEASTLDELVKESRDVIQNLLELEHSRLPRQPLTNLSLSGELCGA